MPGRPGRSRPEGAAILERRQKVAARYIRGQTQWEIARAFEVDQKTISRDLQEIRKEWIASSVRDFDELKSQELAKVDELERTYWAAWDKSCLPKKITHSRTRTGDESESSEEGEREEQRDGNPEFLKGVERCIQKRCDILGLDAPKKIAPTAPEQPAIGNGTDDIAGDLAPYVNAIRCFVSEGAVPIPPETASESVDTTQAISPEADSIPPPG